MKHPSYVWILPVILLSLAAFISIPEPAYAQKPGGMDLKSRITLPGTEGELLLNGAGIRKKCFCSIYLGALYLRERSTSAEGIISDAGAKSIQLRILYSRLSRESVIESWEAGFRKNLTEGELLPLMDRIRHFSSMARDLRRGDEVRFDYTPGEGTWVMINGDHMGTIEGEDFHQALLKTWLGPNPNDRKLKSAMLGMRQGGDGDR